MSTVNTAGTGRIGNFLRSIVGEGLSYNNEYSFYFEPGSPGDDTKQKELYTILSSAYKGAFAGDAKITGSSIDPAGFKMIVLCEEISLPGVSTATGNARGIYQGVDFKYAHTKIYNDLSLSFLCDREYTPLRFFETWFHYAYDGGGGNPYSATRSYTTRLYYDYCLDMTIVKDEDKNGKVDPETNSRRSVEYAIKNAFPTSISSIPLNTGASQVVRFTVNLSYERWSMKVNDPTIAYVAQRDNSTDTKSINNKKNGLLALGNPTP